MKLTKHNGRAGKNGVYNPKHNDRSFDVSHSEHIDEERAEHNVYWDCYNGFRQIAEKNSDDIELASTFEKVEKLYYRNHYSGYTEGQNERNAKSRHTERNRSTEDLLQNKKTCPEESLLQIRKKEEHESAETLLIIATEFFAEFDERFGSHVHILDWALHIDESTPHIHERHVFDCENRYGELCPQQEIALEALGFELPEPEKKLGRHNNRKMVFDATCRTLLFDICKRHGLHLEEEPEYGGRKYLEKQDFILAKQREQMAKQTDQLQWQKEQIQNQKNSIESQNEVLFQQHQKLQTQQSVITEQETVIQNKEKQIDELMLKIEDVESLVDEVTDLAYDKAVEVVTDKVRIETHKHDIQLVEGSKAWVLSPERKASKKEVEYAAKRLDNVITKITNAMQSALKTIQTTLMKPEIRHENTEQIKEKARESILAKLHKKQSAIAANDSARKQALHKKQDMEL